MADIVDKLRAMRNLCPDSDWTQINAAGKSAIAEAEREIERLRREAKHLNGLIEGYKNLARS